MRNVYFAMALVAGLMVTAPVMAAEQTEGLDNKQVTQHFLGKRPYMQPLVAKVDGDQPWVGATLVVDDQAQAKYLQPQKLHMIGKRAF